MRSRWFFILVKDEELAGLAKPIEKLKPDDWTKGESQVIVRAVIEINFVAEFEPQAYGTESRLHAGSRIDRGVQTRRSQPKNSAHHIAVWEQAGTEAKIHEAGFERNERAKSTTRGLELWSDQTVSDAN